MKRVSLLSLFFVALCSSMFYSQIPARAGWWKFDDATNPLKAEQGNGTDLQLVGTHQMIDGPETGNDAVRIDVGSHYKMRHGIQPNLGGKFVNEYSLQIDFRVAATNIWHCFFQVSPANNNDGDCFINKTGNIGVGSTGYSAHTITSNEWYRLVISVKNGTQFKYYLDGQLFHEAGAQAIDGRFGLDSLLLVFADEDGEDGLIDCAELAVWDRALTPEEVMSLGSFHAIDTTPPNAVSALSVTPLSYQNLLTWSDVQGETGATYDVYYSENPITDITKAEVLKLKIPEGTQYLEHILRSPKVDKDLTYYYAIVCRDYSGNPSVPFSLNTAFTNKGKGVPTIANSAPVSFIADGDLSEWSTIPPIRIIQSEGTGFVVANSSFDGDQDCSALAYIAFDNDNLYFAVDVTDDIYSWTSRTDPWMNDAVDLFIGLFDSHNTNFSSYQRGATPHYQMRFDEQKVTCDGSDSLLFIGSNYFFLQKFTPGYIIEAKIPLLDIAKKRNYNYTGIRDSVFHPVEGMKIPIDFSINDADATGNRELVFTYSPFNEDQSWNNTSRWLWTWIGDKMSVDDVRDASVASSFTLMQNYPNPFNPSTKITYTLEHPELVSLKIYDMLGREVAELVNQSETAGSHTVTFNAANLASGMYCYKLEAGSFRSIKKLMLVK